MLIEKYNLNSVEKLLLCALKNVHSDYLLMSYDRVARGIQRPERAFNAELYHQLRKIQEDVQNNFDFQIHQELFKYRSSFNLELNNIPEEKKNIPCIGSYNPNKISPDIVFHNRQNDLLNQLLVAEIKMKGCSTGKIIKDFEKLLFYKLSYLSFKNAILIYSGSKEDLDIKIQDFADGLLGCLADNKIVVATISNNKWALFEFYKINN
jgi:hypothetical protein